MNRNPQKPIRPMPPAGSPYSPREEEEEADTPIILIIKAILCLAAIIAAALFLSFIPHSVFFEYAWADTPAMSTINVTSPLSSGIAEAELPPPPRDEPIETLPPYDWNQPVPESAYYPIEHFSDTVFIGDSRTVGLLMYTKIEPYEFAAVGLNIGQLSNKNYIRYTNPDGTVDEITCMEALRREKGKYSAVYMALGINELGWNVNNFISTYKKVIAEIREIDDVPIYIQLVLPVTAAYSEKAQNGITNENCWLFNERLRAMAAELKLFLLDPTGLFALEDGSMDPKKVAADGVHMSSYRDLLTYYQTHVLEPEKFSTFLTDN